MKKKIDGAISQRNFLSQITTFRLSAAVIVIVLLADQISKFVVRTIEPIQISSFFQIASTQNTGAAFSILQDRNTLLIFLSVLVVGFVVYSFRNSFDKRFNQIALGLLIGGTVGNLVDRIRLGSVTDFIDFSFWPSFNIADSAISVGIVCLVIYSLIVKE